MDFFRKNFAKLQKQSIRWRFFYILIVGGLFFSIIVSVIVFYYIYLTERNAWQGRQKEAALSASRTVASFMEMHEDTVHTISLLSVAYLKEHPDVLKNLLTPRPGFIELVYLDKQGNVLLKTSEEEFLLTNSFTTLQSNWFQAARKGESYLGKVRVVSRDEPHLIIATPAVDGIVAARLHMNVLWEVVADIHFGEQGKAYVINREGQIVAHTNSEIVLEMTNIAQKPELKNILQAQNYEWYGTYTNLDNERVVASTAPIPDTDWIIVTELPQSEAFALTYRAIFILGGILLTFTAGSIIIFTRLVERLIFRPIDSLQRGVQALSAGNLNYRITIKRLDEIGIVAMAFNQMAEELNQLYTNLEDKVADRTRRLDLIATLSQQLNTLDMHLLLGNLVTQIQQTLGYSQVNVYLTDNSNQKLKLFESSKQQGIDSIGMNQEVIRQVVESGHPFMSNDLSKEPIKPLWPDIQSELAVPLKVTDKTLGILDVQSTQIGYFTPEDLSMIQSIADQTAIAVTNAQLLAERQMTIMKLKEVDMAKSQFITMMSHELRTPLNAINGFAELLSMGLSGELPEQAQQDVQLIYQNGQHLLTLINDILEITQLEAGWISIETRPIESQKVIEDVLTAFKYSLQEKSLELVVDVPASLPFVQADYDYLKQIFLGLVGNAIKFTPTGGRITITAKSIDEEIVQFSVIDTGIGIPEEKLALVFESFIQVDMSDAREYGGTGLGLSICKQLVEIHHGEINLKSEVGVGSEFYFTIPAVQPN